MAAAVGGGEHRWAGGRWGAGAFDRALGWGGEVRGGGSQGCVEEGRASGDTDVVVTVDDAPLYGADASADNTRAFGQAFALDGDLAARYRKRRIDPRDFPCFVHLNSILRCRRETVEFRLLHGALECIE